MNSEMSMFAQSTTEEEIIQDEPIDGDIKIF